MSNRLLIFLLCALPLWAAPLNVLIKMTPAQEKYFRERVITSFEKQSACTVNVATFGDNWELPQKLGDRERTIDVVKVPMSMSLVLAEKGLTHPVQKLCTEQQLQELRQHYFLLNLGTIGGVVHYVPRKFETRIMVYLKSRVREAVEKWETGRPGIEDTLKRLTSVGLPQGYALESDPSQWDYYDLFVVGYYWSRTEYEGKKAGRIAHRGKSYSGTALGLMDRCFQMGATRDDLATAGSRHFKEVLRWESIYAALGIYPRQMWEEQWDGTGLWQAFQRGDIFLSFLTQVDCYFLHGTSTKDMPGYAKNPADLGYAVMPKAVGLGTGTGGTRSISTGGWLWGVGANCRNQQLARAFIRHVTASENQIAESDQFGMIPVRKDILGKADIMFGEPWKTEVFETSLRQLKLNGKTSLPYTADFDLIEKKYIDIWKLVVDRSSRSGFLGETQLVEILK